MKHMLTLVVTLLLAVTLSFASAESIFPTLSSPPTAEPTSDPAINAGPAPSYGMMANVAADEVSQNAQGGTMLTYLNVTADGFNSFGQYLGEKGYSVTGTETQGDQTAYAISDGQIDFTLFYDLSHETMILVYPQGTEYEQPAFPGYQKLNFGEEVVIPNLGKFTFYQFILDQEKPDNMFGMREDDDFFINYYDLNGKAEYIGKKIYTYIGFKAYNTTHEALQWCEGANEILKMTLYYVNEFSTYSFEQSTQAVYRYRKNTGSFLNGYMEEKEDHYFMASPVPSLEEEILYSIFDIPSGVRTSTDGTLYATIDFATGDKYIMMLREDGVDCYENEDA